MREGQNRLAEQERAAAAELLEKQRERRDSAAAAVAPNFWEERSLRGISAI